MNKNDSNNHDDDNNKDNDNKEYKQGSDINAQSIEGKSNVSN